MTDEPDEDQASGLLRASLSLADLAVIRSTFAHMAEMLRSNALPKYGREYLAEKLQAIADGADPTTILLPKIRKPAGPWPLTVMAEVERERARRGAERGDMKDVHDRVGRRHDLERSTVKKLASIGRGHLRKAVKAQLKAGVEPEMVTELVAKQLQLPIESVRVLLNL